MHCYSMPLIEGVTLDQRLAEDPTESDLANGGERAGPIPRSRVDESVRLILQAAQGLEHAHQRGVIHRDIKPSNLMVDETGKLWVMDFGLARCRRDSKLTQSGAVVGTLRYMSPEQASGNPQLVDHRSDIYSLGITLYELITGRPAFEEGPHAQLIAQRQVHEPRRPRRCNPRLSRDLETVVLKAIDLDPSQRYQSAAGLAEDLQRYLNAKPILARRPSVVDRISKWTSRHRGPVIAAGVVVLIGLAVALVAAARFARQGEELKMALEQSKARYRQTREVLDHFGFLAAERLRGVAGAEAIREELVRDLLDYYEEFAVTASQDPELREDLATTHFRAGTIIEELGARDAALDAFHRARELFARLAAEAEGKRRDEFEFQLGLCHNNIGLLLAEMNEDGAARHYQLATTQHRALIGRHSGARRELANAIANFGLYLAATDRSLDAQDKLEHSLRILESLADGGEEDDEVQLSRAMTLNNLAFFVQDSDLDQALSYNQRAIEILRSNIKSPAPASRRSLATSLNNQAALLARHQRFEEALTLYREALAIYRGLVDQAPLVTSYTEELAITYNNFGRLLAKHGNRQDARKALERAEELLLVLIRRRPTEPRYYAGRGGVLNNLARLSAEDGKLTQAIGQYRASLVAQEKLAALTDDRSPYRDMLSTTYKNLEKALRDAGRRTDAERIRGLRIALSHG